MKHDRLTKKYLKDLLYRWLFGGFVTDTELQLIKKLVIDRLIK